MGRYKNQNQSTYWCSGHKQYLPRSEFPPVITRSQCTKCSSAYDVKRATRLKLQAIELLGGSCAKCGYNKHHSALDIHHPNKKTDDWSRLRKRNWQFIKDMLIKEGCVLLCANCHREEHYSSSLPNT